MSRSGFRLNPEFERKVQRAGEATAMLGGILGRNALLDTLDSGSPGRGRVYKRGRRRTHQASAPGDPPATDTGRLKTSINIQLMTPLKVRVGTNVRYALSLEYGNRVIAARPWVRITFERAWPDIRRQMLAEFRRRMAS